MNFFQRLRRLPAAAFPASAREARKDLRPSVPPVATLQAKASGATLTKASNTMQAALWPYSPGAPIYTPRNYGSLAKEGYSLNAIVYACVQEIISRASGITLKVMTGYGAAAETVEDHPALALLRRPNPQMSEQEFRAMWAGYLLLSGNSYLHGIAPSMGANAGRPLELWPLRPDRMQVVAGDRLQPVAGYSYTHGREVKLAAREVSHAKLFNPLNDFYGMSPIEAAARGIDQFNAAGDWNTSLLQNRAVPELWINLKGNVPPEGKESLKKQLRRKQQGPMGAREPLVTRANDGIDVHKLGLSAVDLDYLEGKRMNAFEICSAFRVPSQAVGIPGAQTYANFEQAEKSLYGGAVVPMLQRFCDAMTLWLLPRYSGSEELYLWYEQSEIEPLQEDRDKRAQRAVRLFTSGLVTQKQGCREAGVDDDQAEDKYVWELRRQGLPLAGGSPPSKSLKTHSRPVRALLDADYHTN